MIAVLRRVVYLKKILEGILVQLALNVCLIEIV